eukprot:3662021-Amphidinium_carterae.1
MEVAVRMRKIEVYSFQNLANCDRIALLQQTGDSFWSPTLKEVNVSNVAEFFNASNDTDVSKEPTMDQVQSGADTAMRVVNALKGIYYYSKRESEGLWGGIGDSDGETSSPQCQAWFQS